MGITPFNPPRRARIKDQQYAQRADILERMGLPTQEFRAAGRTDSGQVVVHQEDLVQPTSNPFTLREDIVEFKDS